MHIHHIKRSLGIRNAFSPVGVVMQCSEETRKATKEGPSMPGERPCIVLVGAHIAQMSHQMSPQNFKTHFLAGMAT